jgi:acetyltransferase-like isoleucine patch superfamily enzyme
MVKDCKIGEGTKVWEPVNLYGCTIGTNCKIGTFVEIQNDVVIGNNVIVSSHSFLCSLVTILDNVFIGHGVKTINDLFPPSYRRTGRKDGWRSTMIMASAIIGSGSILFPVTIGEGAIIGAGSVVVKDCEAGWIYVGNPARKLRRVTKEDLL